MERIMQNFISARSVTFGVSKARGVVGINQVLLVLKDIARVRLDCLLIEERLEQSAREFERFYGFPDVVGAIDGTLIRIERQAEYEGWYFRKGYPAVNEQVVVNSRMQFLSCPIRSGSSNDQSIWNRTGIRQRIVDRLSERSIYLATLVTSFGAIF